MALQSFVVRILILSITMAYSFKSYSEDSAPLFDYGYGEARFKWGVEVPVTDKESDFKLRIGTRLQSIMEDVSTEDANGLKTSSQDFYVRRARLQVEAKFQENLSYYMDIRNDRVDFEDSGANAFSIGDAFFQVKNLFGSESLQLRLFRAKYDVSRNQTVSSSRLLILNRSPISDYAADFISAARRGTNLQILGNWKDKIQWQIAMGDGVSLTSFKDSLGRKAFALNSQNFAYGARLRISPINGWEESDLTETFFGVGKHFTLGAGHYIVDNVNFTATSTAQDQEVDRQLTNYDLSFHYGPVSFVGEYYQFNGVVSDFSSPTFLQGKSDGWYAQTEYVFSNFHYLAPYFRYQTWNHFKELNNYGETSSLAGINYYLKGNKLRFGFYHDQKKFGSGLVATTHFTDKETTIGVNMMMHY